MIISQKHGFDCQWISLDYLSLIMDNLQINEEKPVSLSVDATEYTEEMLQPYFGPLTQLIIEKNEKKFIKVGALASLIKEYINKLNPNLNVTLNQSDIFDEDKLLEDTIFNLSSGNPLYVYTGSLDGFTTHGSRLIGYRQDDNNQEYFAFLETNKTIVEISKNELIQSINLKNHIKTISSLHESNYDIVKFMFFQKEEFFLVSKEEMNNWKNVSYITFN